MVLEARDIIGGGLRTAEITLPGFMHDVCSSVHPMGIASPFFRALPLREHGLEWVVPPAAAAHPLDDGDVVMLWNDVERTAEALGVDRKKWLRTIGAVARDWPMLERDLLSPIGIPRHPFRYARFGAQALLPAEMYARMAFSTPRARALFAGCAAHSILPFAAAGGTAVGIVIAAAAHARGWPIARTGSVAIAAALASYLLSLGGEIEPGIDVQDFEQLPDAKQLLFDTSPRSMSRIMGKRFPARFRYQLESYPYGPGAFKVDWALSEPIPWKARECLQAATVHVGGSLEQIAVAESAPWDGYAAEQPFVLVTQPSLFDDSRAPAGQHTAWGYCHVPNGSKEDMTERIEAQIERFAPGFREVILARSIRPPSLIEGENANLVGGDVAGGSNELANLFFRPTRRHYRTPLPNVHLCSAATPPGGGIHGMCGYHAAITALGGGTHGSNGIRA